MAISVDSPIGKRQHQLRLRAPLQALPLVVVLTLTGCASNEVQRFSQIDVADKTISVPPGGAGLTGKIKSLLTEAGWHISVYQGPVATEGTVVDDKVRLSTERTFKSRYNLMIRWQQFDVCLDNMQPAISYDISLIDNKSGAEVMTMSGRDCETLVARKFVEQLQ